MTYDESYQEYADLIDTLDSEGFSELPVMPIDEESE